MECFNRHCRHRSHAQAIQVTDATGNNDDDDDNDDVDVGIRSTEDVRNFVTYVVAITFVLNDNKQLEILAISPRDADSKPCRRGFGRPAKLLNFSNQLLHVAN